MSETEATPEREDVKYLLKDGDERERDRLDKQHKLVQDIVGRLLPGHLHVKRGYHVLDSATGTGAWALQLASQYNYEIYVTGIDINHRFFPPNPPQNVTFMVQSILALPPAWTEWFCGIHQRFLSGGLSVADWKTVIRQMHRALNPKGWVRLEEFCATLWPPNVSPTKLPYTHQLLKFAAECSKYRGVDLGSANKLPQLLQEAGFTDVVDKKDVLRLGPGEKYAEMRTNFMRIWLYVRDGMKDHPAAMTDEDFESMVANVTKEMEENDVGWDFHIITARKAGRTAGARAADPES